MDFGTVRFDIYSVEECAALAQGLRDLREKAVAYRDAPITADPAYWRARADMLTDLLARLDMAVGLSLAEAKDAARRGV